MDSNSDSFIVWAEASYLAGGIGLDPAFYSGIAKGWEFESFQIDQCRLIQANESDFYVSGSVPTPTPVPTPTTTVTISKTTDWDKIAKAVVAQGGSYKVAKSYASLIVALKQAGANVV